MNYETPTLSSLLRTAPWDTHRQWRLVAMAGACLILFSLLLVGVHVIFGTEAAKPSPLPPGAFQPTAEQLKQLTIAPVSAGSDAELVRASGSISADGDHSTPVLLPFSGQVLQVQVEAGQYVTRGQPLLQVASPELVDAHNALAMAKAQEMAAAQQLKNAEASAMRQKAIYETAGGAVKDYSQAQADLAAAEANMRAVQSSASAARDHLAIFGKGSADGAISSSNVPATVFRAPVSGLVADRSVAPGQFITAGGTTPILTITDPSQVWLIAQLPESEVANVRIGDEVAVMTPALPGRTFAARIDNIGAALDPATHRLPVRATVRNADGALKPQMFASFAIRRKLSNGGGVLVPARAIIHEGDGARVWLLGSRNLLYSRSVSIADTEDGMTRVVRGLRSGDRIVTAGALFVNEAGLEQ